MVSKLISAAIFSSFLGLTILSSPAEARRLFWWEALLPRTDDGYDVYDDGQDSSAEDLFNQEQYDQYMQEMNQRRHHRIYDQSYYDPQFQNPDSPTLHRTKPKVLKFKKSAIAKTIKPETVVPTKSTLQTATPKILKQAEPHLQTTTPPHKVSQGVETITDEAKAKSAAVSCAKGASIVTSYGFNAVISKSCTGSTYIYGATRSGKNFEIQVSAANGELTAVKKL